MNTSISRGLALAIVAALLGAAQAKDPTDAEVQQWKQAAALTKAAEQKLREYAMDVEHERSYADPYSYDGKYVDEKWQGLAAAERELEPLTAAIAAIEAKFGADADAIEAKTFAEYSNPIDPRVPGFPRRLSPDRSRWLDVNIDWPFTFYKQAKSYLEAPAQWRQLAEDMGIKHVRQAMATHDRQFADDKFIDTKRENVTKLTALLPVLDKVLGYAAGDPELTQLKTDLEAKIAEWEAKVEELIDATEWKPHEPFSTDADEMVEALRAHLPEAYDERVPLAIRISGDWDVYSHNLLGEPTCYYFWAQVAYEREGEDDVAEVHVLKVYTPEKRGVNMGPPLGEVYRNSSYLIRPGNVSQQGGGLFSTLIKLVLGLGCCFMFLAAVGGGGYFAYQQVNAQKAAAAAAGEAVPGAPPATPPGAPPAPPTAPPTA